MAKTQKMTGDLSDEQARAIGHMTVNFNWMEHAAEALTKLILSPNEYGLADPLIDPMRFSAKLDVLKKLVKALSQHYAPTPEVHRAYQRFQKRVNDLIAQARALNTFRNGIIHWRPFLSKDAQRERFEIDASVRMIESKSIEMNDVGTSLFACGVYLRKGDHSLTFGAHVAKGL